MNTLQKEKSLQKKTNALFTITHTSQPLLLIAALLSPALALLAFWVHKHDVDPLDLHISHTIQSKQTPLLQRGSTFISYAGSPFSTHTLFSLLALGLWQRGQRKTGIYLLSITLLSTVIRFLLQKIVSRPRPAPTLVRVRHYKAENKSFPSGHVTATIMVGSWLIILTKRITGVWRVLIQGAVVCMMVLIGPARIYQGKHWASDILGGYLLGSIYFSLSFWAYTKHFLS